MSELLSSVSFELESLVVFGSASAVLGLVTVVFVTSVVCSLSSVFSTSSLGASTLSSSSPLLSLSEFVSPPRVGIMVRSWLSVLCRRPFSVWSALTSAPSSRASTRTSTAASASVRTGGRTSF